MVRAITVIRATLPEQVPATDMPLPLEKTSIGMLSLRWVPIYATLGMTSTSVNIAATSSEAKANGLCCPNWE